MKRLLILAATCMLTAACGWFSSEKHTFEPDYTYFPMCLDESDSTIVFVNIENGNKESKYYKGAYPFYNDYALVYEGDGWTFIDKDFEYLIHKHFLDATHFSDGISLTVRSNEYIKAIDTKGNLVFEAPFAKEMIAFNEGYAVFKDVNDKYGVVDTKGNIVIQPKYTNMGHFVMNDRLTVKQYDEKDEESRWGVINMKGEIIIPCKYDYIESEKNEEFTVFKDNDKCALLDEDGEEIIGFEYYSDYDSQPNGTIRDGKNFICMTKKGKIGWIDEDGEYVIDPEFINAKPFADNGLAAVEDDDEDGDATWGYIDDDGEWVIKPKYVFADSFTDNDMAIAAYEWDEFGVIDEDGEAVIRFDKEGIMYLTDDYYLVMTEDEELGVMEADGDETWSVKPIYEYSELIRMGPSTYVKSDYVDIKGMTDDIESLIKDLDDNTLNDIVETYGISPDSFSRSYSSRATLMNQEADNYELTLRTGEIHAWTSSYDYWDGYQYTFNGDQRIYNYKLVLDLNGEYANKTDSIKRAILKKLGFDENATDHNTSFKYGKLNIRAYTQYYDEIHFEIVVDYEDEF